ncbi:MAG: GNAT family N-acetyltransferase [bacterium]
MSENKIELRRLENINDLIIFTYLQGTMLDCPDLSFFTYSNEEYKEKFVKIRDNDDYKEFEIGTKGLNSLGVALIYPIDFENRNTGIRISLKETYSREIMIVILKEIIDYCFNNLNLIRVYGHLLENRSVFREVIETVAKREATLYNAYFSNGKLQNILIYGILRKGLR